MDLLDAEDNRWMCPQQTVYNGTSFQHSYSCPWKCLRPKHASAPSSSISSITGCVLLLKMKLRTIGICWIKQSVQVQQSSIIDEEFCIVWNDKLHKADWLNTTLYA